MQSTYAVVSNSPIYTLTERDFFNLSELMTVVRHYYSAINRLARRGETTSTDQIKDLLSHIDGILVRTLQESGFTLPADYAKNHPEPGRYEYLGADAARFVDYYLKSNPTGRDLMTRLAPLIQRQYPIAEQRG